MAAVRMNLGSSIHKNYRLLIKNIEQLKGRSFSSTSVLQQQATELEKGPTENIAIPRKKEWSKTAVLEALSSTVKRDPTACAYIFQDDSFLSPRTSTESKLFQLSLNAGKSAAKYFIDNNPTFFTKDFAVPHIPCLMPETLTLSLDDVSEEALKERIGLRKVTAAVEMYDQLLQAGTVVSMETIYDLLELVSFYCGKDPVHKEEPHANNPDDADQEPKQKRGHKAFKTHVWKADNSAERIFNLLPEKDTRCYSALIRGMQKHGNSAKAFSMYTDMLNNRLTGDVNIFNALIAAVPNVREDYHSAWHLIVETLNQMSQQKVKPNLLTFNSVLKAVGQYGSLAHQVSFNTVNEMKALGIAPSLATYNHLFSVFNRKSKTIFLEKVLSELDGQSFTCRDPDDVSFFSSAMKICRDTRDLELAHKVHSLVEIEENLKLLGNMSIYCLHFFSLLCMTEPVDTLLKWYRQLYPSMFYPNSWGLQEFLQALDTGGRLDMIPMIWKDIYLLGHDNKLDLVEMVLSLMARDVQLPEVQESFATCALEVKKSVGSLRGMPVLQWTKSTLSNAITLLLRANNSQKAWELLQIFKENSLVPTDKLLDDFMSLCKMESEVQRAVELVKLSSAFCLQATPKLADRALTEFNLDEEQRALLKELDTREHLDD